jgi:transcriptional regulator with XRE-family HTH domain
MGCAPEPNYHGRRLIRALKSLRDQACLTQEEAGEHLNFTLQKMSRFENGQLPGWHELQAMLDLYGLPTSEWPRYLELWEQARERGWWRKFGLKDPRYVRMEDEASAKYEFQLGHIPTLLQTERYARDLLTRAGRHVSSELPVRMHQQERLYSDNKLRLHTLVHEPALHQGVDRAQLVRLIRQAELPNVTLQVVSQRLLHAGLHGSVILLSFDDPHEPDIAFTETLLGLHQTQQAKVTSAVRRTLDHLAATAMTPDDSLALLKAMA